MKYPVCKERYVYKSFSKFCMRYRTKKHELIANIFLQQSYFGLWANDTVSTVCIGGQSNWQKHRTVLPVEVSVNHFPKIWKAKWAENLHIDMLNKANCATDACCARCHTNVSVCPDRNEKRFVIDIRWLASIDASTCVSLSYVM